jgi:hypothetical protein
MRDAMGEDPSEKPDRRLRRLILLRLFFSFATCTNTRAISKTGEFFYSHHVALTALQSQHSFRPRHSVAWPAALQIMFKNNEEFSIFELLRDVFTKRFHGSILRRLNDNG